MAAQQLRDYQQRGLEQILAAYRGGARVVLAVAPTGSGKTTIFTHLTSELDASTVILVHRRELATQAANRLREFGVDFGFIMAGEPTRPWARVQIASVQTLVRRAVPRAGLVICDEAHLSTANTWTKILGQYPRAKILGFTATPWRLSGKPLAGAYDACVVIATPRELREQGHLCDYIGFSYKTPDLSDVKTTAGDYNEAQSAEKMREPSIVANVVEQWLAHASALSTVVFAVTVEHSKQLTAEFRAAGVRAEHLDGQTPTFQRMAILRRVESGETQVLCNVGVAVEGLDIPRLKCCVLARPTKSLARALQMPGRVRRPWDGLTARIHDHAFLIRQHGLPDDDRDYRLSGKVAKPPVLTTCEKCLAVYRGPTCKACGGENEPQIRGEREIVTVPDAEQFTFTSAEQAAQKMLPPVQVEWKAIGRSVEGRFESVGTDQTQWGPVKTYRVIGAKRTYWFHGTAHLNAIMAKVKPDDMIRVTFSGEIPLGGGKRRKVFKVEVNRV